VVALEWWQCRWLGRFKNRFTLDVPPGDVAVIHAQPVKAVPFPVSVSHHITGGYIVENVSFDRRSGKLRGALRTKEGLRMVLFGGLPEGWELSRESKPHAAKSSVGAWQCEVLTTGKRTRFAIRFEKS